MKKFLAFDIETAKIIPERSREILAHRPLGICCIGAFASGEKDPAVFYSTDDKGTPAPQMTREDISDFVDFLIDKAKSGYSIFTWNGAGFDFDVLAEESGRVDDCKKLASRHVDGLFHVFCVKGFFVGLGAAGEVVGEGKLEGVRGGMIPRMWKEGKSEEVLQYLAQDCRLALAVAEASESNKELSWVTRKGSVSSFPLPQGWLSVDEARNLPEPDTSWMDNPPAPRSKFIDWLDK